MYTKNLVVIILVLIFCSCSYADGLLMPVNEDYPKEFLKNRCTRVTVNIKGVIAQTHVYQEFVNEWHQKTDAVYSFPLPPNARAVRFLYWYNDVIYQAVLEVKEQAVNPGTGEGGIVAEVNRYIGRNGIKIKLIDIEPGSIQKVRLDYISLCEYYKGNCIYRYPLDTRPFIKYPLEHLEFDITVQNKSGVINLDFPTGYNETTTQNDVGRIRKKLVRPKSYCNEDFIFTYETVHSELMVDFYSTNNDTSDGHFGLFPNPIDYAAPDSILPRRIIFLLSTSGNMFGYRLSESITAIGTCLSSLEASDVFNIITFDHSVGYWRETPVAADSGNIKDAREFLSGISSSSGSNLGYALEKSLDQIKDNSRANAILCFSDGGSQIDPRALEAMNPYNTGIFPVGIGEDLFRERLEMIAGLNYGFVTYINENDNIKMKILQLFDQISQPILKNVVIEYGKAGISRIIPEKPPSTYAGSYFFMTGRYQNPGSSALTIAGNSAGGSKVFNFNLEFSKGKQDKFVEYLWAKEMIDQLEREIEIYGASEELKQRLIELSLKYNIRCRYTAYIADYESEWDATSLEGNSQYTSIPKSYILGNYPNPFNPETTIEFYISAASATAAHKFIKIYNTLGQLVFIIDISSYQAGHHRIKFHGKNYWGQDLPSGTYIVVLQIGDEIHCRRISLVR